MSNHWTQWQQRAWEKTERVLHQRLPEEHTIAPILHEAMRYATLGGGKRLRPSLVLAAANLGEYVDAACEAAMAAVEFIHVYSLVHDDLPAMDNDDLRRGKPTCHVRFDEATALLTGDALQTLAFETLSQPTDLPAARQLRMVHCLAQASGSVGMAGGQAIDLANVGKTMTQTELAHMHRLKTGALIRAAVQLGALCCPDMDEVALAHLDAYATHLGLAFQVMDDVLDSRADTHTLGKTAGKDQQANKPTYVQLLGQNAAQDYTEQLVSQAIESLNIFDQRAEPLRELARFTVLRDH